MSLLTLLTTSIAFGLHSLAGGIAPNAGRDPELPAGIEKIQHVVVIMQENRSFDTYFGTYPGAEGFPMQNGKPSVCVPDPEHGGCIAPYLNTKDSNQGGPHGLNAAVTDMAGGSMNGFIAAAENEHEKTCKNTSLEPNCVTAQGAYREVMGYHDASQIPNYWAYAKNFVLQERMFEPNKSWSLPAHLFEISGWSARCPILGDPMACVNAVQSPEPVPEFSPTHSEPNYQWTDLTYLLHKHGISWKYYDFLGGEPRCDSNETVPCSKGGNERPTPEIWSPLPYFSDVHEDRQLPDVESISNFYRAAGAGTLPSISWLAPNDRDSEHPPAGIANGQAYVTSVVNAIMRSPDWWSSAIFISWDDWGGFYDNVMPPQVDANGYGLRVPGLLISPYARHGYIDHQTLSHDAYLKFIEDVFLGGERLNPATDGRPDSRIDVREESPVLGNLASEFNFSQPPAAPLLLPTHPSPWAIPADFRLRDSGMAMTQTPARQNGALLAHFSCSTRCRLAIRGALRVNGSLRGGEAFRARTLSLRGSRTISLHLRPSVIRALHGRGGGALAVLHIRAVQSGPRRAAVRTSIGVRLH